jgi:L-ascorbate metabolism protein UlaG (beta-lactamase superfamily)
MVTCMQLTRFGHSCLLIVDGDARVLIDPGTFSAGFESLTGLTAVLITHQHPDHLDLDRLPAVIAANPDATVYADAGSVPQLQAAGIAAVTANSGDAFDVGTSVEVLGRNHAQIHQDIPIIPNACYLIGGRLLHPGDSLELPNVPIEILALPAAAPWMAAKEAIEYYRTVGPRVAFPIHEKILAASGIGLFQGLLGRLGPQNSKWLTPADGEAFEV